MKNGKCFSCVHFKRDYAERYDKKYFEGLLESIKKTESDYEGSIFGHGFPVDPNESEEEKNQRMIGRIIESDLVSIERRFRDGECHQSSSLVVLESDDEGIFGPSSEKRCSWPKHLFDDGCGDHERDESLSADKDFYSLESMKKMCFQDIYDGFLHTDAGAKKAEQKLLDASEYFKNLGYNKHLFKPFNPSYDDDGSFSYWRWFHDSTQLTYSEWSKEYHGIVDHNSETVTVELPEGGIVFSGKYGSVIIEKSGQQSSIKDGHVRIWSTGLESGFGYKPFDEGTFLEDSEEMSTTLGDLMYDIHVGVKT